MGVYVKEWGGGKMRENGSERLREEEDDMIDG